jgi:hypothetical protein
MRKSRLLGLALMAFLALSVIGAATAAAEFPEILPLPTPAAPLKFTSKGGVATLTTTKGLTITCEDLTNKGEFTSARLGVVTIDFLGACSSEGIKCKTAGDETGTILTPAADIHLVDAKKGTELRLDTVVTPKPFTISCGVVKSEIRGAAIGLGEKVTSLVKTSTLTANFVQAKGEQEIKECELDKAFCEGKKFGLEANFGAGFELAGENVSDAITLEKEAEFHF